MMGLNTGEVRADQQAIEATGRGKTTKSTERAVRNQTREYNMLKTHATASTRGVQVGGSEGSLYEARDGKQE